MDYQQLLLALLPDLLVVVALFAALGVDYSRLRGSRLAKRYQVACQISAAGLIAGLAVLVLQIAETMSVICLLYTSPSPRDQRGSRMPSSA